MPGKNDKKAPCPRCLFPTMPEHFEALMHQLDGDQDAHEIADFDLDGLVKTGESLLAQTYRVEVPCPGFSKEQITVTVDQDFEGFPFLDVEAECTSKAPDETNGDKSLYYGSHCSHHHVSLPPHVIPETAQATCDNGIVIITFKTRPHSTTAEKIAIK